MSDGGPAERDDRVLPGTRIAALAVFLILVPALIVLWGLPGETADLWAWTIKPDLTPVFLGSGYGAGAYFFWRTYRAERWHPSSAGVFSAAAFATAMLVATLLHWDKFNQGDAPFLAAVAFFGWVSVYIASPLAVFYLWWDNHQVDPRTPAPGEAVVSDAVRTSARVLGVAGIGAALVFFISTDTLIDLWPWQLTPLTARVLASFMLQVGAGAVFLSFERRWSGWRLLVQTFFVATALLLAGAARAFGDFDDGDPATYLYLGGLAGSAFGLFALYRAHERRAAPG